MNIGTWRITNDKKTGNMIIYHQNQNTLEYTPIKVFKIPKSHIKKKKKKKTVKKKCSIQ